MTVTNYTRVRTCIATGEDAARRVMDRDPLTPPGIPTLNAREYLGPDSSFEQRAAFDWGVHAAHARRVGDDVGAAYASARALAYVPEWERRSPVHVTVLCDTPFARVLVGASATRVWSHALANGEGADPDRNAIVYSHTEPSR